MGVCFGEGVGVGIGVGAGVGSEDGVGDGVGKMTGDGVGLFKLFLVVVTTIEATETIATGIRSIKGIR